MIKSKKFDAALSAIITILSIGISLYHIYTSWFGLPTALKHRIIHLGIFICIAMLLNIRNSKKNKFTGNLLNGVDLLIAIAAICSIFYSLNTYDRRALQAGIANEIDIVFGAVIIIAVLWTTYRRMGWGITSVALVMLAYTMFGHNIPGAWGHRELSANRIIGMLAFNTDGILGAPLGASSTYVILFVMLAAFLEVTGAGQFFINMAAAVTGRFRGGPAKSAVLASSLFGTISGSAIANTVGTGTFTIPLMKKSGFEPEFAAAVEAVASTGGQIMPPIMGSTAFIIAEVTGTPYIEIMKAAIVPAIMYYVALFMVIDAHSAKRKLLGIPKEMLPNVKNELIECGHMVLPLIMLIVILFMGYTALRAGLVCLITTIIISFMRKNTRIGFKEATTALCNATRQCIEVVCATSTAGIIVGSMFLTGLGTKMANIILTVAGGNLLVTLILTAFSCIILGMGMPSVASYLILSVMVVPTLLDFGLPKVVAHLFVFYFGITSAITPPVAMAAYAGAGIAGSNPTKTGYTAFKLGIAGFIVPFMFVYSNELVLQGTIWTVVLAIGTALIGIFFMASSMQGWMLQWHVPIFHRMVLFISAIFLIKSGAATDLIGLVLGTAVLFSIKKKSKFNAQSI